MGICLPAGKKRLFAETHLRNWRIGLIYWSSFSLSSCHALFIFLLSHAHVSYLDMFFCSRCGSSIFSDGKKMRTCQCIHLCHFDHQFGMDFTCLAFIVMYCHVVLRLLWTHKLSGKFREEDLKCSKNCNRKQIWYYSHFIINMLASSSGCFPHHALHPPPPDAPAASPPIWHRNQCFDSRR